MYFLFHSGKVYCYVISTPSPWFIGIFELTGFRRTTSVSIASSLFKESFLRGLDCRWPANTDLPNSRLIMSRRHWSIRHKRIGKLSSKQNPGFSHKERPRNEAPGYGFRGWSEYSYTPRPDLRPSRPAFTYCTSRGAGRYLSPRDLCRYSRMLRRVSRPTRSTSSNGPMG